MIRRKTYDWSTRRQCTLQFLVLFVSVAVAPMALAQSVDWAERRINDKSVEFPAGMCTESGAFGQQFRAKSLTRDAIVRSSSAGRELGGSEMFVLPEVKPPFSWYETGTTPKSKTIHTVTAYAFFSTRELADAAHEAAVAYFQQSLGVKEVSRSYERDGTSLFTRPLVVERQDRYSRQGLMVKVNVQATVMSIECTDSAHYLSEIRYAVPMAFDQAPPPKKGLAETLDIREAYCTKESAFGFKFGAVPDPTASASTAGGERMLRPSRSWPPFETVVGSFNSQGQLVAVEADVDFQTHALAHKQALSIIQGLRTQVRFAGEGTLGLWPVLYTDPPYLESVTHRLGHSGVVTHHISGLMVVADDSGSTLSLKCQVRELTQPNDYEKYRLLRDAQKK